MGERGPNVQLQKAPAKSRPGAPIRLKYTYAGLGGHVRRLSQFPTTLRWRFRLVYTYSSVPFVSLAPSVPFRLFLALASRLIPPQFRRDGRRHSRRRAMTKAR